MMISKNKTFKPLKIKINMNMITNNNNKQLFMLANLKKIIKE